MKTVFWKIGLFFLFGAFLLSAAACGHTDVPGGPVTDNPGPEAVTPPDYENEKDPVKAMILFAFSNSEGGQLVRIGEDHDIVNCKVLNDLLDFASWEETSETIEGESEMILEIGECNLEIHGHLVKAQHLDVAWPAQLDFDSKWYRINDESSKKVHAWMETVNLDPYAYTGGSRIYKFVKKDSDIYSLKNSQPKSILFHESDGVSETEFSTKNEKTIRDILLGIEDIRVLEEKKEPEGQDLTVTFVLEDSSQVQMHFVNQCLEYEESFYSLFDFYFFKYVGLIKKGEMP
jgi:hypothetical protein